MPSGVSVLDFPAPSGGLTLSHQLHIFSVTGNDYKVSFTDLSTLLGVGNFLDLTLDSELSSGHKNNLAAQWPEAVAPDATALKNDGSSVLSARDQALLTESLGLTPAAPSVAGTHLSGVSLNGTSHYGEVSDFMLRGDDFELTVWFSVGTVKSADQKILTFDKDGAGAPVFQLRLGDSSGFGGNHLLLQTHAGGAYLTAYTDNELVTDTGLHKIRVVKTGTSVSFYFDDVLQDSSGAVHDELETSSTGKLYLGKRSGGSPSYFEGSIYRAVVKASSQQSELDVAGADQIGDVIYDRSGYRRDVSLTAGTSAASVERAGVFSLGAVNSSFTGHADFAYYQAGASDGTHIWVCSSDEIAKYTVAGVEVEKVTNDPGLTSWGGMHLHDGVLYLLRFSESEANKIYSFDPDDLAAGATLVATLTDLPQNGANGLLRLSNGKWLAGLTNSTLSADKQNRLYLLDSGFNLEKIFNLGIFESAGVQSIIETETSIYVSGHDADNLGPSALWRLQETSAGYAVADSQIMTERLGALVFDPTSGDLVTLERGTRTVSFRALTESPLSE